MKTNNIWMLKLQARERRQEFATTNRPSPYFILTVGALVVAVMTTVATIGVSYQAVEAVTRARKECEAKGFNYVPQDGGYACRDPGANLPRV